ncbi:MAG TPA: universal stress protein [Candidatus Binatia bacterium]|jgi:nucleotide-binding universal stress UspA family protein|nr:universal stress protein [Candidatus Binatia bacterium]
MYTRMLIPLDGSKLAENVLPYARTLAGAMDLRIELLSVVDTMDFARTTHAGHVRDFDPIIEAAVREGEQYLENVARSFTGSTVNCVVEQGQADQIIIDKAAGDKETLIGMATRGRSGIHRWLMGSVAEKVLRGATNPLLLVRGDEEGKSDGAATLKSIVVPLDGSKLAESVLPRAIDLAKKLGLEIVLTRAYQLPLSAYPGADTAYIPNQDAFLTAVRGEAGAYLEAKVNEIRGNGIEKVSFILLVGSGADEIIDLARTTPDNLIAMCTHGRSGVKRWALGSVTEKVVRHSGDPVLVVRAE